MPARRIQDYAVIGDCRTAALVSRDGSVDWLCWPRFDSPSIFGALLDPKAGRFAIAPTRPARIERRYEPDTNVLVTEFSAGTGTLRLTDWMPISDEDAVLTPEHELARTVECLGGEVELSVVFDPRPGYASAPVRLADGQTLGWRVRSGPGLLILRSPLPLRPRAEGGLAGVATLYAGESLCFSLSYSAEAPAVLPPLGRWTFEALHRSVAAWRSWVDDATYQGPWREQVRRSALALKLLSFAPSGAIVAAPTTSLPERPGGSLNWDYRYCWLRDASLTARALFGLGFAAEARAFISWLLHATRLTRPRLNVLYDVFGRALRHRERDLPWEGFGGARPVRVGNAAQDQLQLDVYGEVVDATVQFFRRGGRIDHETERALGQFGDYVCDHWREPDEGIWELRSGKREHTHSRVLCWAALDRLLELHRSGYFTPQRAERYRSEREAIRADVESRSFDEARGSYVAIPGGQALDATLLLLPLYGYQPASSERMRQTYRAVCAELGAPGGLLRRYRAPESEGEGAFGACGFWAVQYLAHGGGSLGQSEELFEALLEHANDLGLFAEEVDPASGDALGNFPQAFTHVGLVNAALAIEERRGREEQRREERARPEREGACAGMHL